MILQDKKNIEEDQLKNYFKFFLKIIGKWLQELSILPLNHLFAINIQELLWEFMIFIDLLYLYDQNHQLS